MPDKRSKTPRVRMNMSVTPETRASVKAMNAAGVGRSEGAVVDLAVEDLAKYHAKKGGKA